MVAIGFNLPLAKFSTVRKSDLRCRRGPGQKNITSIESSVPSAITVKGCELEVG